jgi:hypothetical protein
LVREPSAHTPVHTPGSKDKDAFPPGWLAGRLGPFAFFEPADIWDSSGTRSPKSGRDCLECFDSSYYSTSSISNAIRLPVEQKKHFLGKHPQARLNQELAGMGFVKTFLQNGGQR